MIHSYELGYNDSLHVINWFCMVNKPLLHVEENAFAKTACKNITLWVQSPQAIHLKACCARGLVEKCVIVISQNPGDSRKKAMKPWKNFHLENVGILKIAIKSPIGYKNSLCY